MTLNWTRHDHIVGTICAVGLRGVYSLQHAGGPWWLTGVGHDTLPMLALPVAGRPFASLEAAQRYAERLDAVKSVEAEVSGT